MKAAQKGNVERLANRKNLKGAEDEILTCTLCGYCKESCPFFNLVGWDSNTSRGRILLSYALLHGKVAPDAKAIESVYKCTLCRRCENDCSSKLKILPILEAVRKDLAANGKLMPAHLAVLKNIESAGNIYGDKTPTTEMHDEKEHKAQTAYFAGCVSSYSARKPAAATRKLLKRLGIDYTMMNELCCGAPNHLLGADLTKVAKGNMEKLKKLGVKTLICSCDGCFKMFKEVYPKLVKSDIVVKHIGEVLLENLAKLPEPKSKPTVSFHDSCDLGRHMKMYDMPRKVLAKFANIKELPNTKDKALCCGTGGGARIAFGAESDGIALRRLNQAENVAEILVTTCPACSHSMEVVAKKNKKKVEPKNLVCFVEEMLGK